MTTNFRWSNKARLEDIMSVRSSYPEAAERLIAISQRYQKELAEVDNRIVFTSFHDNEAVAYVQMIVKDADGDPELANGQNIAHVHDLRVRKEFQGQGIGREMMRLLETEARRRGIETLTLGVDNWNTAALSLYEKLGYRKFKETLGRTDDEICFYLRKKLKTSP